MKEHAVLIFIKLSDNSLGNTSDCDFIESLENKLVRVIKNSYDGHEYGGGYCTIYMYSSDADDLYALIAPILKKFTFPEQSFVIRRYGEPGSQQESISLTKAPN